MAAAILKAMSTTAGENTIIRTAKYACFAVYNWRQNCWDIVLKWDNLREQNSPHPSPIPSIQSWGISCFQQVARTAAQRCMEGVGEGKIYFSPFKLARRQRGPLGQSLSTNFVADCREIARERKRKTYITPSSLFFRVSSSTALDQSACEKSLCYCNQTWIW